MKIIFCINKEEDIKTIQQHQIKNLFKSEDDIIYIDDSIDDIKQHCISELEKIEDEIVLFFPINCVILKEINQNILSDLLNLFNTYEIDYIRLRKIGKTSNNKPIHTNLYTDYSNLFYLVPHLIKTKILKNIISRIKTKNRNNFWLYLETKDFKGSYYFNINKDSVLKNNAIIGWKNEAFDTSCNIIIDNKWSGQFLEESNIKNIMAEYNILPEERGIYLIGCCS